MIPSQIARHHCANFQQDGSCLGVYYNDDLSIKCCKPLPKCLLFAPGIERCAYFEECVMPMKLDDSDQRAKLRKQDEFDSGVLQYRRATGLELAKKNPIKRLCPKCRRRPLDQGRRFCDHCRDENRKSTLKSANEGRKGGLNDNS